MKFGNTFRSSDEASPKRTALRRILISRSSLILFASILVIGATIIGPARLVTGTASANTLCVNPAGSGGCFSSIQAAVNAAMAGDTINVAAGTYNESVNVNKQVFLRGANTGVNACTGSRVAESIVQGSSNNGMTPFNITANDVVLDGFTVQGATNANQLGFGIVLGAGTSGSQVLNNIVQNNIAGLSLANSPSGNQAIIQGNNFQNNNQPGPVSGTAIYTDQFNAGGSLAHVLIDNNCFTNNQNVGVLLGPTTGADSSVTISRNTFTGNGNAVLLFNTLSSTITQNTFSSSTGSQVVIGGGVSGLQITENFIQNGATRGVRIGDLGGGSTNSAVNINCNSISGNPTAGLEIDSAAGAYTGTLDATNNWWGSASGPTIPSNPAGTGDKIIDPNTQVVYNPFLTSNTDSAPTTTGFQCVCATFPASLVSWWRAENNANDTGPGMNNGTLQNGATFAPGKVGQAFNFDGIDDFVNVPDNANLSTQTLTLDAWIRTSSASDPLAAFIATKSGTNGLTGYEFGIQPSTGRLRFTLNGGVGGADLFGTNVLDNQLHFVAATYDGAAMKIYLDGQVHAQTSVSTAITYAGGQPFIIGSRTATPVGRWSGVIDELEFFNQALTQPQILAIYTAGSTGKCLTPPAPVITSAGATLVSESCAPGNGVLDPGETVTVSFCVQNTGSVNTTSLMGTLQATGGVTNIQPPNPQNYGVVVAGGPPVCRNFTFTVNGTCGGTVTASIQFQDGATNLGVVTYTFTLGVMGVCCSPPACTITCPANITRSNDPNQCGAVVTYPAPTTTGTCGTVTCSPASGSFFPKGTTTVTCTASAGPSCQFTVMVNDTQPPTITCPPNITAKTPTSSAPCATVNFTTTASDNCPGVTVVCNPPSGACFPVGTTTVTCTATDTSGNTATCSFTVSVFNVCLQDDSNPAIVFLGNSVTGAYRFCCNGTVFTGVAQVTKRGSVITFTHNAPDRRVQATDDEGVFKGTASIQSPPGTTRCTIADKDTRNNSCVCP